jgi:hypothetical protein
MWLEEVNVVKAFSRILSLFAFGWASPFQEHEF